MSLAFKLILLLYFMLCSVWLELCLNMTGFQLNTWQVTASGKVVDAVIVTCVTEPVCLLCKDNPKIKGPSML